MLTLAKARELQPGGVIKCHVVAGLELHATASGKSWKLYYRNRAGERRRPKIGEFPALTIELARDTARELLQRVALGGDPSAERHALLTAPTVADLGARYLEYRKPRQKPRTHEELARHITKQIAPSIGSLRVAAVTPADIDKLLRDVESRKFFRGVERKSVLGREVVDNRKRAPIAANRVRESARAMFKYAVDVLKWRTDNPVTPSLRRRENKRKVHIKADEFRAVMVELRRLIETYPYHVSALLVMLYSGTRVTEILQCKERNLQGNTLVLTEHKSERKGEDRVIRLSAQSLRLISALPVHKSGYIFGGVDRYSVFRVWEQAREAAGVPHVQMRDLRRTFASVALSEKTATLDQIGDLFNHSDTKTTKGYSWLMDEAATAATQATADKIDKLAGPGNA